MGVSTKEGVVWQAKNRNVGIKNPIISREKTIIAQHAPSCFWFPGILKQESALPGRSKGATN
jgi:hypothetical protein